jgi:hypothetical protein
MLCCLAKLAQRRAIFEIAGAQQRMRALVVMSARDGAVCFGACGAPRAYCAPKWQPSALSSRQQVGQRSTRKDTAPQLLTCQFTTYKGELHGFARSRSHAAGTEQQPTRCIALAAQQRPLRGRWTVATRLHIMRGREARAGRGRSPLGFFLAAGGRESQAPHGPRRAMGGGRSTDGAYLYRQWPPLITLAPTTTAFATS